MADIDDLKQAWKDQPGIADDRFEQIANQVRSSTSKLQSTIFRRDLVESLVSLILLLIFGRELLTAKNWVSWSGFAVASCVLVTIPIVLWWARKRRTLEISSANFRDFIAIEVDYVRRQVLLLRRVTWWCLLPMYIGICLIAIGISATRTQTAIEWTFVGVYLSGCALFFMYVRHLNQTVRKNSLEPLLNYYTQLCAAIDSGVDWGNDFESPPTEFLTPQPKVISRAQRILGIALAFVSTAAVVLAGVLLMQRFDVRTGIFVISTAPFVAVLVVCVTGVWRRNKAAITLSANGKKIGEGKLL